jgi:SAM-dependent methyltransferase
MGGGSEAYDWEAAEKELNGAIDTTVPVSARIWNYWLGGKDYYQIDKEAGDQFLAQYPNIANLARAYRLFLARTVTYLARDAGVRQFLDIGTGLPTEDNTHEIAQRAAPDARVVYVDNDPLVLAHARALLTGTRPEATDYIAADLNEPDDLLRAARGKLNFDEPVAVMLMGVLGHVGNPAVRDDAHTRAVVASLKQALPPGGYLVIGESADTQDDNNAAIEEYNETGAEPYRLRSVGQIRRLFDGFDPVPPGIVQIQQWRPDESSAALPQDIHAWGAVARRP